MIIVWCLLLVLVIVCTWSATVERAMFMTSPVELRHEMEIKGTPQRGIWIEKEYESTLQALLLVKMSSFVLMTLSFVYILGTSPITLQVYIVSACISLAIFWLTSSVMSSAIARAVPTAAVLRSWYLIRFVSLTNPAYNWWIEGWAEIARRLTGANLKEAGGTNTVEEQLLRTIEHSQREGGIPAEAAEMLENVVDLGDTDVGEIMTPRTEIEGIELTNDISEIRKFVLESGRSRIPIFEENLDQILGILYVKDMIGFLGAEANGFELKSILRKPIVVPDTKSVQELLADFQTSEVHMAVVIDEYGGTAGLVTIEDVLEEIVGEIRDEHDEGESDEPELVRTNETTIEVDGRYNLDDINDELVLELPEDEEYDTIAGFMLAQLGHVPSTGESIRTHGVIITATEVSETQIIKLSIDIASSDE